MTEVTGRCLCGGVRFRVPAPMGRAAVCHCGQCRRQSGHLWASDSAPAGEIEIAGEVRWYAASETAKRGFCPVCGSFLFWKRRGEETMAFSLGSLETPTGIALGRHIFTADKGDYYDLPDDGLPRS